MGGIITAIEFDASLSVSDVVSRLNALNTENEAEFGVDLVEGKNDKAVILYASNKPGYWQIYAGTDTDVFTTVFSEQDDVEVEEVAGWNNLTNGKIDIYPNQVTALNGGALNGAIYGDATTSSVGITFYDVTKSATNGYAGGAYYVASGTSMVTKVYVTPNDGYAAPTSDGVSVSGASFNYSTEMDGSDEIGIIELFDPTGDVTVTAECPSA